MKVSFGLLLNISSIWPLTQARPSPQPLQETSRCQNLIVRQEWRSLTEIDRKAYIDAVKCLIKKPAWTSKSILPGATNRFEDLLGDHIMQADANHFVGHFYPWHRLMIRVYEKEIRACGFRGAQPYWDWSLDTGSSEDFFNSPVFDTNTGFGGNGHYIGGTFDDPEPGIPVTAIEAMNPSMPDRSGGGCIHDGPFANMSIHMGPGLSTAYNENCVRRDFVPSWFIRYGAPEVVAEGMTQPDFGSFSLTTEISVHNTGHVGVGGLYGTLTDVYTSPGDPLFYLHHANLDRLWWSWQNKDAKTRLSDISGPLIPFDYSNEQGRNVTLDDIVRVGTTVNETVAIRDIMDIHNEYLCYTYDKLY